MLEWLLTVALAPLLDLLGFVLSAAGGLGAMLALLLAPALAWAAAVALLIARPRRA